MNGWVQIPCPLSTLARWPLRAVSGQRKLTAINLGLSKVSKIDRQVLLCIYIYIYIYCYIIIIITSKNNTHSNLAQLHSKQD